MISFGRAAGKFGIGFVAGVAACATIGIFL